MGTRITVGVLALCVATSVVAQDFRLSPEPETINAVRFSTPPQIDGAVDPSEWSQIGSLSRRLVIGGTNQDSGERGQVWIGYDDTYLYIAAKIVLQNPDSISADEFRDNVSLGGNDNFQIKIDTFGEIHDYNEISFNANGATRLEIAGGRAAKLEWSGRVESQARMTETGWEGEVRVPWALLPMPAPGKGDMRFDFDWYVSAADRSVTSHTNQGDPTKVHTLAGVEIPAVKQSRPWLLLPYGYLGYNDETEEHVANAGLDVKSAITQDMNLVATFNPDFRNIEGDVLNLDFSNFERLGNETRPFFQEGSDYYFFGHGSRIFASQRIKEFDMGANIYGNLGGDKRLAVMSTVDFDNQATFSGSFTLNPDDISEVTASFASLQREGEDNNAGRLAMSRRFGNWNVFTELSGTDDRIKGGGNLTSVGAFYDVPGWRSFINYQDISNGFFPRVGFAPQTGYRGGSASIERELDYASGPVRSHEVSLYTYSYDRLDGSHYREGASFRVETKLANLLEFEAGASAENFENRHDQLYSLELQYPGNSPYRRVGIEIEKGHLAGAGYTSYGARVRYRPIRRLQLSLRAQSVKHIENEDQLVFDFNFEKGRYESLGGRMVYDERNWNWYASYRMSGNEGAEYFLILGDPNSDSFQKTLIFKVSVPLSIGG